MTVISNSVEIRCTTEQAFDYLSDHRSELEWNPGIESIEKLTDGPVGLGTRYLAKWKSAPKAVEVETTAFDRPHGWTVHNGGPVEGTVDYLSPQPEYTPPVLYNRDNRSKLVYMAEAVFAGDTAANLHPGQPVDVSLPDK